IGYACNFQPNPVNLANGAAATVTLTLSPSPAPQSVSRTTFVRKPAVLWRFGSSSGGNISAPLAVATCLLSAYLLAWPRRRSHFRPALVCGLACMLSLLGCGGGGGGAGISPSGGGNGGG